VLAGCAGGSEPRTGEEPAGVGEQTTEGTTLPAGWATTGDTTEQPSRPALTAAEEKVTRAERAQVLAAARQVATALEGGTRGSPPAASTHGRRA
jgi:hypothetical protein